MHVSSEPVIPSTREELAEYLVKRVRPADIDNNPSFGLRDPYTVPKSEPCAITGISSTASSRVNFVKAVSDQSLLLKYLHSLHTISLRFRLGYPSNIVIVKSSLQKYLVGEFPILILTLSDATLNKLIRLMGSDNKFRELKWKEGDMHLDPYRKTEPSSPDFNDSMFQLVLLDPDRFSEESLTIHNPITNTKGVYVAGSDGYLRESPGGIGCPIVPPMPFYEGRPRATHRTNPFYVALSSAFIFERYQSDPTRFNGIPEKARALLSKTLRIKELVEWKFRTEQGTVPPRYGCVGSMANLTLWTTGDQAEVAEDDEDQSDVNPVDFCLAKIPDEYLKKYLNGVSEAYTKTREEDNSDTDEWEYSDEEEDSDTDSDAHMRSGTEKGNGVEGYDIINHDDAEVRRERLEFLDRFMKERAQSEGQYSRKEITNLQYGFE